MEGTTLEKNSYSLDSVKDIFLARKKPLNMGLVDDILVVHYEPNMIETFLLSRDKKKIERGSA
jgi:hypothetical protein